MENRTNAIMLVDDATALEVAERILPKFPRDCNRQQAIEVARVALAYGLDPFLGELIPYQGQPYITIAGRIRLADSNPMYDGYDIEPATEAEIRALRADEDESVWKCTAYRKDRSRPVVAFGRAGGKGEQNPVAKRWMPELAQKRAIHRALRAAFPAPIPGLEESLSPEQLRAIHAIDAERGVGRDERHDALQDTFGVESSADLTKAQATAYIDAAYAEVDEDGVMPDDDDDPANDFAIAQSFLGRIGRAMNGDDLRSIKDDMNATYDDLPAEHVVSAAFKLRVDELRKAKREPQPAT